MIQIDTPINPMPSLERLMKAKTKERLALINEQLKMLIAFAGGVCALDRQYALINRYGVIPPKDKGFQERFSADMLKKRLLEESAAMASFISQWHEQEHEKAKKKMLDKVMMIKPPKPKQRKKGGKANAKRKR